ncbi:unnamed protein product [Pleuronectes platessa]|uniref:Uncharacterized protein n=1 Tax=Pleuronectes platessa TaxID=8262 RepID=A0A9N7Z6F9_PLEPL|nr:unnamed protein product [Pleuronectes platessa]
MAALHKKMISSELKPQVLMSTRSLLVTTSPGVENEPHPTQSLLPEIIVTPPGLNQEDAGGWDQSWDWVRVPLVSMSCPNYSTSREDHRPRCTGTLRVLENGSLVAVRAEAHKRIQTPNYLSRGVDLQPKMSWIDGVKCVMGNKRCETQGLQGGACDSRAVQRLMQFRVGEVIFCGSTLQMFPTLVTRRGISR